MSTDVLCGLQLSIDAYPAAKSASQELYTKLAEAEPVMTRHGVVRLL